jgi:hypothetical protein
MFEPDPQEAYDAFEPDEFVERGKSHSYRDGVWTDLSGMRLSMTESQQMTDRFFAEHGRTPKVEPPRPVRRRTTKPPPSAKPPTKAELAKQAKLRKAIAKAKSTKPTAGG